MSNNQRQKPYCCFVVLLSAIVPPLLLRSISKPIEELEIQTVELLLKNNESNQSVLDREAKIAKQAARNGALETQTAELWHKNDEANRYSLCLVERESSCLPGIDRN